MINEKMIKKANFNTSHVTVKQMGKTELADLTKNFNTSHVTVKP